MDSGRWQRASATSWTEQETSKQSLPIAMCVAVVFTVYKDKLTKSNQLNSFVTIKYYKYYSILRACKIQLQIIGYTLHFHNLAVHPALCWLAAMYQLLQSRLCRSDSGYTHDSLLAILSDLMRHLRGYLTPSCKFPREGQQKLTFFNFPFAVTRLFFFFFFAKLPRFYGDEMINQLSK